VESKSQALYEIIDEALIDRTKGFLYKEEGLRLYQVGLEASRLGPCLEIGSYCGKSTLYLGAACKKNSSTLFAVDHHSGSEEQQPGEGYFDPATYDIRQGRMDTYPLFRKALIDGGLEDTVVPVLAKSEVAARQWATPLSLVGPGRDNSLPVNLYHRMLTWDIMEKPKLTRYIDKFLNPILGKSLVLYFKKR